MLVVSMHFAIQSEANVERPYLDRFFVLSCLALHFTSDKLTNDRLTYSAGLTNQFNRYSMESERPALTHTGFASWAGRGSGRAP